MLTPQLASRPRARGKRVAVALAGGGPLGAFFEMGALQVVECWETDVPDGQRCGNVYYGPILAARDVYTWDAATLPGALQCSFAAGCDNAPAGTITYPSQLMRL